MKIFQNTRNTRPILKDSMKYVRSDVPTCISEDEIKWLLSNKITTVVDLRTKEEQEKDMCPLLRDSRFTYYTFSVTVGNTIPKTVDDVSKSYMDMVDEKFDNLISFLLHADSNVLYFCSAGKDRTGVVTAALLYKMGLPTEYIVDDYMQTKRNLGNVLNEVAKHNPTININVITPHKRYIEEFLSWYTEYDKN